MKKEEIRRGLRSLIQDTTKELEKIERVKKKKAKLPKKEAQPEEKVIIPKIKIEDGHIKIESHYYPMLNDFIDKIAPHLTSAEEIIYHRLYRLSFGWGKSTCRVSISTLNKISSLNSSTTIRKALKGLINKKCIIPVIDDDKNKPYDNQVGTLYRILLPHEIILKQTHDGLSLDDIPAKGISKSVISKFDPTFFDMSNSDITKNDITKSVRSNSNGTKNNITDPSKNDITEIDPSSLKPKNNQSLTVAMSKNDITKSDYIKKQYKNNNKNTLSPYALTKKFYSLLNQDKISKQKRERALRQINELIKEGFSLKDIDFAIEWTVKNKSNLHSFGIIAETIGEALSEREKYLKIQQEKERLENEKREKERKQREEESLQRKIQEIKNNLPKEELAKIHQEAEKIVKAQGNEKKFGQDILVKIKENEIIRNLYLQRSRAD